MSRSGYLDDYWGWELAMYRGQVQSAIRGRRGQRLLRDLVTAMDVMPDKRLACHVFKATDGAVCPLQAVADLRGVDISAAYDDEGSARAEELIGPLDIASQLAREVMYINDEHWHPETEQERWHRVRAWVVSQLSAPASAVETEPTK